MLIGAALLVSADEARARQPHEDAQSFLLRAAPLIAQGEDDPVLSGYFPAATLTRLTFHTSEGKTLQWVAVRWESPTDGGVFVVDGEQILAGLRLGGVLDLRSGPAPDGLRGMAQVRFEPSTGTNFQWEQTALLAYYDGGIVTAWRHDARNLAAFPLQPSGEEVYTIRFDDAGRRIEVRGIETIQAAEGQTFPGGRSSSEQALPPERYCWSRVGRQYLACPP